MNRTIGISPKVLYPVLAALGVVAQQWASTGKFDRTEVVSLVMTAIYAVIGAVAPPGEVSDPAQLALPYGPDAALEETDLTAGSSAELGYDDDDELIDGLSSDEEDDAAPDLPADDAGSLAGAGSER
jgi:hypothetical protein